MYMYIRTIHLTKSVRHLILGLTVPKCIIYFVHCTKC